MTRAEIERRLHIPLLAVLVAGMESTAAERERKREQATEQVISAVERMLREETTTVVTSISKSVRRP